MKARIFYLFLIALLGLNFVACKDDVAQPDISDIKEDAIESFTIYASRNKLKNDIHGLIDESEKTITISSSAWIENIKSVVVDFESLGTVSVNGIKQISGESTQSFLNDLVYTVTASDGTKVDYQVVLSGPMFTGLPIVSIFIENGEELKVEEKTKKLPATFYLRSIDEDAFDMTDVEMTIRGRGNSTWYGMPKKPFRVDFLSKTSLFGLTKAKKWVFLANYQDPTLLMNDVAFELGRRVGVEFNHSSIHVEVFINGTYRGNYQLTEQKETGEGRVDINTDGGFLVELDTYFDEDYQFHSNYFKLPVMIQEPEFNSNDEMDYVKEAFNAFESTLYGENFPSNEFEKYTDVESLINFMLVNEIVRNQELHWPKSTYLYKEADSKIKWGPLWDFDWAFGYNEANAYFVKKDLLFYAERAYIDERAGNLFFARFFEVPGFKEKYYQRWEEVKPDVADIVNYIDEKAKMLEKSQLENFKLGGMTTPNTKNASYGELINQMKDWIEERIAFLDRELRS